jgi:hypothetical protein
MIQINADLGEQHILGCMTKNMKSLSEQHATKNDDEMLRK